MNVTELAHWKYRVEALCVRYGEIAAVLQDWSCADPGVGADAWNRETQALRDELDYTTYLLEEAKYMAILGAL